MKFWDSSAIVPLCVTQPATAAARSLNDEDREMVVWWGSTVECASAFARLRREGILDLDQEEAALAVLTMLNDTWYEVQPGDALREQAMRLLRLHPLRAADALQLAAALEWTGPATSEGFITFDERLTEAARLQGFQLF